METPDPTNPLNTLQTGGIRSRGFETEAVASILHGLDLHASYKYLDEKVTSTTDPTELGKRPTLIPKQLAGMSLNYTVTRGEFAGARVEFGVRYVPTTSGDPQKYVYPAGFTTRKTGGTCSNGASSAMGVIDRPQNRFWPKAVFQVHLWSGIIAALYMVAISASGSVLVFETELMDDRPHVLTPWRRRRIDYTKTVDAAQRTFPGEALTSIDMQTDDRRFVTVTLKSGARTRVVYVDAAFYAVAGSYIREERHDVLAWFEHFHNELAGGRTGGIVNGIGGAVLALICVTGIVIWWPGIKIWRRAIAVQWRARWKRINYDLHNAIGFWTLLFVAMWGATGVYFIFPHAIHSVLGVFQNKPLRISQWKPGGCLLPAGEYVDIARRTFGDGKLAFLFGTFSPAGSGDGLLVS